VCVERTSYSGITLAFQANDASSILAVRFLVITKLEWRNGKRT